MATEASGVGVPRYDCGCLKGRDGAMSCNRGTRTSERGFVAYLGLR